MATTYNTRPSCNGLTQYGEKCMNPVVNYGGNCYIHSTQGNNPLMLEQCFKCKRYKNFMKFRERFAITKICDDCRF